MSIPNVPGAYQLVLYLPQEVFLRVGALGSFLFPVGRYVYTGSALGGLRARVVRHLRLQKRLRWHMDYLLQHAHVEDIRLFPTQERIECALNRQLLSLPDARVVARGFGSSDCHCPAHLVYLANCSIPTLPPPTF
ncbi:MAG: GIY-YIG nuclease family protein [Armatimonadota bacterium]|nr:GIY-YIG nuclease family protein [Armatimonadota bacterium]